MDGASIFSTLSSTILSFDFQHPSFYRLSQSLCESFALQARLAGVVERSRASNDGYSDYLADSGLDQDVASDEGDGLASDRLRLRR